MEQRFCGKCGSNVKEGSMFCPKCGEKIIHNCHVLSTENTDVINNTNYNKKRKLLFLLMIFLIIVIVIIICVLFFNRYGSVDNNSNSNIIDNEDISTNSNLFEEITESDQFFPDSSLFDEVLANGDDYFLVSKYEEDYDYATMKFGVIGKENNWLLPLSDDNVFGNAYKDVSGKKGLLSGEDVKLSYKYIGTGVFICTEGVEIKYPDATTEKVGNYSSVGSGGLAVYCYNAEKNAEFVFEAVHITPYENGYMLMYASNRYNSPFYKIDNMGKLYELPVEYDSWNGYTDTFPAYSEGLFYANRYFYDIDGNIKIDLTDYDLIDTDLHFNDGKCEITFKNPGGTTYKAAIDKNGNFIDEPKPIE